MTKKHLVEIQVKAEAIVIANTPEEAAKIAIAHYVPPVDHQFINAQTLDQLSNQKEIEAVIKMGARNLEDL